MSFFSSVAPDEDFAETYKLVMLRNAATPLKTLKVSVGGGSPIDIIDNLSANNSNGILYGKTSCLATALSLPINP